MPCVACSLQMGKFTRSSSQSSSRQNCSTLLGRASSTSIPRGLRHALQVGWQMVLIIHLISSLSPMLIQSKARQCRQPPGCGMLQLVDFADLLSPRACGGPAPFLHLHTPVFRRSALRGLSGRAAQALLTNLSHQSHSLLQPAPNIQSSVCHLSTPH